MPRPITASAIEAISRGVFARPDPTIVEAYSEPDRQPQFFRSAPDLATYISDRVSQPRGLAHLLLLYPDMGGRLERETIHLDPKHCPGQKFRYTWQGWGLISIQLYGWEQSRMSRIASNSETRARTWAATYPGLDPPSEWNWKAVESHTRRLQRIFRRAT